MSFGVAPQGMKRATQLGESEGIVGRSGCRFPQRVERLLGLARRDQGGAEVEVGVGVVGSESDGLSKLADALRGLTQRHEGSSQGTVRSALTALTEPGGFAFEETSDAIAVRYRRTILYTVDYPQLTRSGSGSDCRA